MDKTVDDVLTHFGVLGMKWGVRRNIGAKGLITSRTSGSSEDYRQSRALRKKGAKHLSTQELQTLTKRLQLEQSLHNLSTQQVKRGSDWVAVFSATATAATTIYTLAKSPTGQKLIRAVKKAITKR